MNLSNRPIFTNYINGYGGSKNSKGQSFSSEMLKRYFSQVDAELYFGTTYVDEIVQFAFGVQQNTMPLTGYNSYMYDEVAQGSRMINGRFSINFTSPGYLERVLEDLASIEAPSAAGTFAAYKAVEEGAVDEKTWTQQIRETNAGPKWKQSFDIDIMLGQKTSQGSPVHITLTGVVILAHDIGLDVSGKVLLENYSFLARNIRTVDTPVNKLEKSK